jgi:ubiquinone/menaquinone biosynthesis C-methylase UbiE
MAQDLWKIEKLYDSVAKEYAEEFAGEHERKPKDQEVLRRFSQMIGDRRPVWDFGCGCGETSRYLRKLGMEISGLDLSEKMLREARAKHPRINFRRGNILDLKFKDNSIAGIVAFYAIVHFTKDQVRKALGEMFRVLVPGGLLLITYHIGDETIHMEEFLGKKIDIEFMLFSSGFIFGSLEETGFEGVKIIEREPYPDIEYESRRGYAFAVKPAVQDQSTLS